MLVYQMIRSVRGMTRIETRFCEAKMSVRVLVKRTAATLLSLSWISTLRDNALQALSRQNMVLTFIASMDLYMNSWIKKKNRRKK